MTLHEAIEIVLQETGIPMTTREIAGRINKRKLYTRGDKQPVPTSQIGARVKNYPNLFLKENGKIRLVRDDVVYLETERLKREVRNLAVHGNSEERHQAFLKLLKRRFRDLLNSNDNSNEDEKNVVRESTFQYGYGKKPISKSNDLSVLYELLRFYQLQDNRNNFAFDERIERFIAQLPWFSQENQIVYKSVLSVLPLLKIAADNPENTSVVREDAAFYGSNPYQNELNQIIVSAINNTVGFKLDQTLKIGIFIPPFNITNILDSEEIKTFLNPEKFDKTILIVPASYLLRSREKQIREGFISSGFLKDVVQISKAAYPFASISLAMLFFDFSKKRNEVFFWDTDCEGLASQEVFNQKIEISKISRRVAYSEIISAGYELSPARYVFSVEDIPLEPGYEWKPVEKLISKHKRGVSISSTKLYADGEFPVIRSGDIEEDVFFFNQDKTLLAMDADQVFNTDEKLVQGGIVLTAFNEKLKANILPKKQRYLIGNEVIWIAVDKDEILEEYLIHELKQDYVQEQVRQFSSGVAIIRLSLQDFLKIRIKVPSLDEQHNQVIRFLKEKTIAVKEEETLLGQDFIHTLEHSFKQPLAGLSNDLKTFGSYINRKINEGHLPKEDYVIPLFDTDSELMKKNYALSETLDRMRRAVTDMDYILKQAGALILAQGKIHPEQIELKPFLENIKSENTGVTIEISGTAEITGDRKQWRILFQNFIDNAKKHGFKDMAEEPKIWIDISQDKNEVEIAIRNNGKSLPKEFTITDFLAKGKSSKEDVGSGFGGFLIGQILKNHHALIVLSPVESLALMRYNVEFIIKIPKL